MAAGLRRMTFFVLDGKSTEEVMEERGWIPSTFADAPAWEDAVQRRIKSEAVELRTSDDRSLKALWTSRHCPSSGPSAGIPHPEYAGRAVAVLFHANAQIGLDLCEWARWYRNRNLDALLVTMGGYAGSEGPASEANGYLDAQAALDWVVNVQKVPPHRIIAHGLSIGGALACALAESNPGVHLTLDQSFSTGAAAAHHVATTKLAAGEMGLIPSWAINGVVASCLPAGLKIDASGNCNGDGPGSFVTDGFDNVSKLRRLRRRAEGTLIQGGGDGGGGGAVTTSQQPTAEQQGNSRHDNSGDPIAVSATSMPPHSSRTNPLNALGGHHSGVSDHGNSGEVFFFVSTHDDMVPPAFTEVLLRARYGGDSEDELSSDDDDDDYANEGGDVNAGESVGGWRAWISRFSSLQPALTADAGEAGSEGSSSTVTAGAPPASPASQPLSPTSPLSPSTLLSPSIQSPNGPESPDAGAGGQARPDSSTNNDGVGTEPGNSNSDGQSSGESSAKAALSDKRAVQLDGVIKSMSMFLCRDVLCEDLTSDHKKKASNGNNTVNPRASRREARQSKREEVNARLAAVRSSRMGVVSGGHGAFFGADRRAAATYEVFLRQIGLLNH